MGVQALPLTDVPGALIETWLASQLGFCEPTLKETDAKAQQLFIWHRINWKTLLSVPSATM